jgi:hypothetical protein
VLDFIKLCNFTPSEHNSSKLLPALIFLIISAGKENFLRLFQQTSAIGKVGLTFLYSATPSIASCDYLAFLMRL